MSAAESHVQEWIASEAGADLALLFCPPAQRDRWRCWGALLAQIDATRFDLDEPTVARAKLAWWAEELIRGGSGHPRHPLLHALLQQASTRSVTAEHWRECGQSLLLDPGDAASPSDVDAMLAPYRPFASALARIEAVIFEREVPAEAVAIGDWLRHRRGAGFGVGSRWPLQLLARHQARHEDFVADPLRAPARAVIRDVADTLATRARAAPGGSHWRQWRALRDQWQLDRWARGDIALHGPGAIARLGQAWRAGRAARRVPA